MDNNDGWPWWNCSASSDLETPPSSSVSSSSLDLVPGQQQAERLWQRTDLEERTKQEEAYSRTPPIPTPDRSARHPPPFPARNQEGRRSAPDLGNAVNQMVLESLGVTGNTREGGDGDNGGPVSARSLVVLTIAVSFEPKSPRSLS
ncbi:hypothetical protein E2562_036052 [Oryza meyeriana var. granulata]|uniref:Uncharacterized protein n=1 Tax=Oryza meyeriana var. granulata TaxID=110450 RepID=A0A6G1DAE9_9ORYZ|nr:hypothetical protein E2562_036052 [Oryza meyeriana var. granulata]